MTFLLDLVKMLVLALPVAFLAWTISREEITRELRDKMMKTIGTNPVGFKLAYLFRCGFCLSPWLSLGLCWWLDLRLFGDGFVSLLLTALACAWVAAWLQASLAAKL